MSSCRFSLARAAAPLTPPPEEAESRHRYRRRLPPPGGPRRSATVRPAPWQGVRERGQPRTGGAAMRGMRWSRMDVRPASRRGLVAATLAPGILAAGLAAVAPAAGAATAAVPLTAGANDVGQQGDGSTAGRLV